MKKFILVLGAIAGTLSLWGITAPPTPGSQRPTDTPDAATQAGGVTFTNRSGAVYSTDQLGGQLQDLRRAVEETLPTLTAFTETYTNAAGNKETSVTGKIEGLLSGVLNKSTNAAASSGQPAAKTNGLMADLRGLLSTNAPGATPVNATTARDLAALQAHLQAIEPILQRLNVGSSSTQESAPGNLPPTGR